MLSLVELRVSSSIVAENSALVVRLVSDSISLLELPLICSSIEVVDMIPLLVGVDVISVETPSVVMSTSLAESFSPLDRMLSLSEVSMGLDDVLDVVSALEASSVMVELSDVDVLSAAGVFSTAEVLSTDEVLSATDLDSVVGMSVELELAPTVELPSSVVGEVSMIVMAPAVELLSVAGMVSVVEVLAKVVELVMESEI